MKSNIWEITMTSSTPKLFEQLIYKAVFNLFQQILISNQHGFYPDHSFETNWCLFAEYLHENLDKRIQVGAIYPDFSKAYDKLSHNILLLTRWLFAEWITDTQTL